MSEEEVLEIEESVEEIEEGPAEKPNLYVALVLLSTKGGYVAPGMVTELDPATAQILLIKGKVRPVGKGT